MQEAIGNLFQQRASFAPPITSSGCHYNPEQAVGIRVPNDCGGSHEILF